MMKFNINFNQLRAFYKTAKHLNYTKAAEALCVSQPAITTQVKRFEESLSLKLFKKNGRRIFMTDEGKTIYDIAHKIFQYEKDLNYTIEEMRQLKRGTLTLGTVKTYARYVMPFLIAKFHKIYPDIKIQLDEGSSQDMIDKLIELKNELAIVARIDEYPDVCFLSLSRVEIVVIVPPGHHLSKQENTTIEDLSKEPIIIKEKGSATRKYISELFTQKGLTPNILMETSNPEFIKQLVQQKEGISFLPREEVFLELREKTLVKTTIKGKELFIPLYIAYLKNQPLSLPTQAFLDMLKKVHKNMPFKHTSALLEKILS